MNKLNELVQSCIEQHVGGEAFFDSLDEKVRDEDIIQSLINKFQEKYTKHDDDIMIVVSGKFGRVFYQYHKNTLDYPIIVVKGGLRKGEPIDNTLHQLDLVGKKIIFFDDSIYSGKTREVINNALAECGASIVDTYVVYDGSLELLDGVNSLYRYHNPKCGDMAIKYVSYFELTCPLCKETIKASPYSDMETLKKVKCNCNEE